MATELSVIVRFGTRPNRVTIPLCKEERYPATHAATPIACSSRNVLSHFTRALSNCWQGVEPEPRDFLS